MIIGLFGVMLIDKGGRAGSAAVQHHRKQDAQVGDVHVRDRG